MGEPLNGGLQSVVWQFDRRCITLSEPPPLPLWVRLQNFAFYLCWSIELFPIFSKKQHSHFFLLLSNTVASLYLFSFCLSLFIFLLCLCLFFFLLVWAQNLFKMKKWTFFRRLTSIATFQFPEIKTKITLKLIFHHNIFFNGCLMYAHPSIF